MSAPDPIDEHAIREKFERLKKIAETKPMTDALTKEAFAISVALFEDAYVALLKLMNRASR